MRRERCGLLKPRGLYAECLRRCGIQTPDTLYFSLPNGLAAFASKRFDRLNGQRVPMQSRAAFTGADYTTPGVLDYVDFLRATHVYVGLLQQ